MSMLDYYTNGLTLFKENPPIIILVILLATLNLIVFKGIFEGVLSHPETFSPLLFFVVFIIVFLVDIFVSAAVIGITPKMLLKEKVTLKNIGNIGIKYLPRLLGLDIIIGFSIMLLMLIISIILALIIMLLHVSLNQEIMFTGIIGLFILLSLITAFFTVLSSQAVVIGRKSVFKAIKQSLQLVWDNKIKTLILLFSMIIVLSLGFIPIVGSVLSSTIGVILSIYITIVITQVYIDLTK